MRVFSELQWYPDRVLYQDLVFRLVQAKHDAWEYGDACFDFFKGKWTVDQYAQFWSLRLDFSAEQVLELGIYDGGSTAFWFESLQPQKMVALDIESRGDSAYFKRYVEQRGLAERLKTYWQTDQGDAARLLEIVAHEFHAPLDLVIDDASHLYALTKASFQTLFPLLRHGGLYIIEDWAWSFWRDYHTPNYPLRNQTPLSQLIWQLTEIIGSTQTFAPRENAEGSESVWRIPIRNITIFPHFVAIERGDLPADAFGKFDVEQFISRRPPLPPSKRWRSRLKRAAQALRGQ